MLYCNLNATKIKCCKMSQQSLELCAREHIGKQSREKASVGIRIPAVRLILRVNKRVDWGKLKCQGVVLYVDEGKREGCLHVCRDESSIHRAYVTHTHS